MGAGRVVIEQEFRRLVQRFLKALQLGDLFRVALMDVFGRRLRPVAEQAWPARVGAEVKLVVEHALLPDQREVRAAGAESEEIAAERSVEIRDAKQPEGHRQHVDRARSEVEA